MPSRDLENLAVVLEKLSVQSSADTATMLGAVSVNLRALAEQVHMLEEIPLPAVA